MMHQLVLIPLNRVIVIECANVGFKLDTAMLVVLIPLNRVIVIEYINTYEDTLVKRPVLIPLNRVIVIELNLMNLQLDEMIISLNPLKSGHCY